MIILGDIASPNLEYSLKLQQFFKSNESYFKGNNLLFNLEGLLSPSEYLNSNYPILYNHPSVLDSLSTFNVKVSALANNHSLDLPDHYYYTLENLTNNSFKYLGISRNTIENDEVIINEDGYEVIILNYCWDFLNYNHAKSNYGIYISELDYLALLNKVREIKKIKKDCRIIIYLHWSFDLEVVPFPMYRKFSKKLIDLGADLIVGTHSHCIQGAEAYRNGHIVYGIGNFWVPWKVFMNGSLTYPDFCRYQLVLLWDVKTNSLRLMVVKYNGYSVNSMLEIIDIDTFESSKFLDKYGRYDQMSDNDYLQHYLKHRRKRLLIPRFENYDDQFLRIKIKYLKSRAIFARLLARNGILSWAR